MRRTLLVLLGIAFSVSAGLAFLIVAGLIVPQTRDLVFALVRLSILSTVGPLAGTGMPWPTPILQAIWFVSMAVVVAPTVIAALAGELAGWRSLVWYGGVAACLSLGAGLLALPGGRAIIAAESRVLLLLFVAGALSGLVYWAIAGRCARKAAARDLSA